VPEELLDGPDVVAGQEEMGREGMPQGVAGGVLGDASCSRGDMEGSLDGPLGDVVAAPHSGPRKDYCWFWQLFTLSTAHSP